MATINYRIKSKENKEVSIYVYFRPSGSSVISAKTSYTVNPKNWSKSKKRAKASDPHLHNLNISLDNLVTFLSQSLNYDNQQGVEIDNKWLKKKVDEFNNKVPVSDNSYLLNFLDLSIEGLDLKRANDGSQGLKKSTIKGYNTFRNILKTYEEAIGSKIRFNGLDKGFIDDFFKWLVEEKKYAKSQSSRLMKRLKKLLKEAQVEGITVSINPDFRGLIPINLFIEHSKRFTTRHLLCMLKKEKKCKKITKEGRDRVAKTTFQNRMRIIPITYPNFPQTTPILPQGNASLRQ